MMKNDDEEFIKAILEKDSEFKKAYMAHEDYEKKLRDIDKRLYLSTEEQLERKRLQKLKLAEKDKMEAILSRYRKEGDLRKDEE